MASHNIQLSLFPAAEASGSGLDHGGAVSENSLPGSDGLDLDLQPNQVTHVGCSLPIAAPRCRC